MGRYFYEGVSCQCGKQAVAKDLCRKCYRLTYPPLSHLERPGRRSRTLYVLAAGEPAEAYKIGSTASDLAARIDAHQTSNHRKLRLVLEMPENRSTGDTETQWRSELRQYLLETDGKARGHEWLQACPEVEAFLLARRAVNCATRPCLPAAQEPQPALEESGSYRGSRAHTKTQGAACLRSPVNSSGLRAALGDTELKS